MGVSLGISPLPDRSAVCATLMPLPRRQPVRLRERLTGTVRAVLAASDAVLSLASLPALHAVTAIADLLIQRTE
jgi:hypothetical protein